MARKFVQRHLEGLLKKKTKGGNTEPEKKSPPKAEIPPVDVFDDTDVCRVLQLRRRVLVAARTRNTRGVDWDVRGTHAGMTRTWVLKRNPKADLSRFKPVKAGDGIVTVQAAARVENLRRIVCTFVGSESKVVASVRDSRYIRLGDQFDCQWLGRTLYMVEQLNTEVY